MHESDLIAQQILKVCGYAGGSGSTIGTFLGVLFMGLLSNGMTLLGVGPYW